MLDAPDREAAHQDIDCEKDQSRDVGLGAAKVQRQAERAAGERGGNSDPHAAEGGRKEYRREIRGEEYVRPEQGKTPPCARRQGDAGGCEANIKEWRRSGYSLPALPEFLDQFHHGDITSARRIQNKAKHSEIRRPWDSSPIFFFFACESCGRLEHDPEKWKPVFRKDHAQTKR